MTVEMRALSRAAVGSVPVRIVAVSLVPLLRILGLTTVFDDVGVVYSCLVARSGPG
ncbi:MAG: hypothetical protein M3377_05920 [Actinomycetota bacterium]|nr:hypothetical protein [Actinomycetota bacterium]